MATTVVSLPLPLPAESNPSEARKRRREILSSQRNLVTASPDPSPLSLSTVTVVVAEPEGGNKRRRVSDCTGMTSNPLPQVVSPSSPPKKALTGKTKPKKPQMKYDPDVPMTKEEAAAWRREQRRKRNRESAAASRQRQRDRIVELEEEVEVWKAKFEEAMKRIQALDGSVTAQDFEAPVVAEPALSSSPQDAAEGNQVIITTRPSTTTPMAREEEHEEDSSESLFIHSPEALVEEVFRDTTFLISPSHSPRSVSPAGSPVAVSSSSVSSSEEHSSLEEDPSVVVTKLPSSKMISRPA